MLNFSLESIMLSVLQDRARQVFLLYSQVYFSTLGDSIKSVVSLIQLSEMCGSWGLFFFRVCILYRKGKGITETAICEI